MKKEIKKKTAGKIKTAAKNAVKKTGVLVKRAAKKAGKEAGKAAKVIQKKWKETEPERAKYAKEIGERAKVASAKGMEMLKIGLKHGMKISGDVSEVIKKDLKEIYGKNKKETK